MSRKHTPDMGNEEETPALIPEEQQPEAQPPVATAALVYVGPPYDKGIGIFGRSDLVRPAQFSPEQVAEFVKQYPKYANWWQ